MMAKCDIVSEKSTDILSKNDNICRHSLASRIDGLFAALLMFAAFILRSYDK